MMILVVMLVVVMLNNFCVACPGEGSLKESSSNVTHSGGNKDTG